MRVRPWPALLDRVLLTCVRETHREVHSRLWQPRKRQEHHHAGGPAPEHPGDAHRHPGVQPASSPHQSGHDTILSPSLFYALLYVPTNSAVAITWPFIFASTSSLVV